MERVKRSGSRTPSAIAGNRQIQKQKTVPKLASESSSCSHGTNKEDLFMLEAGQCPSKRVSGTPMKKLLAEEMSKETVAKKRSLSVIAKLMGLDGLPSPQPIHRQQRKLSDNYPERIASIGVQRNGLYDRRSDRKSSMEQQEFKDVYEDPEASHVANHRYSSKHNVNATVTKQQLAFIQKKCDEMVRESEEIHNKLERVDSNTDLMLKFLQQPDSLFVKHLHDQQGIPSSSICSHIAVLKPSNSVRYENYDKGWKEERQSRRTRDTGSRRRHEDGLLGYSCDNRDTGSHRRHEDVLLGNSCNSGTNSIHRLSRIQLKGRVEPDIQPTRIVVLKPNLGKMQDTIKTVSSPDDCRGYPEYFNINTMTGEAGSRKNKGSPSEVRSSSHKSREAREMAREITSQMRESFGSGHIDMSYSGVRRYVRDDSLYNTSVSDSASEEVTLLTSRNSFDWNKRYKSSPSNLSESSVSKEAKKRMSERWKMTHGYKDVGMVSKGGTLGEMLSTPDREMRSENLDDVMGLEGASNKFSSTTRCHTPSGISSMDGWRDEYLRSTERSGSLSPSFGNRSHKASVYREALADEKLLMHRQAVNRGRSKGVKGNFNQRDELSSKNLRYNKKFQSPQHGYACNTEFADCLPESCSIENPIEINFENKNLIEQQLLVSHTHDSASATSSVVDAVIGTEITMPCDSYNEFLPKHSTCTLGDEDFSALDQDNSNLQELSTGKSEGSPVSIQLPGPEPESSESSKEADHLSLVSVLEVASLEDVSSGSDCFQRVNADLHELRKHLQLLKMESESNYEGPILISNEAELDQGSVITAGNWESSYLVDVLSGSGFYDTDQNSFTTTWHSTDCPLGPWLFDSLEKKYSDNETIGSRSERKLLYDRINVALLQVFQWSMNSYPWVGPLRIGAGLKKFGVEDQLHKLLASQEKDADEDVLEKVLDKEMNWFENGDDIDEVGKEIEELLINDLVVEVLTV